MVAVSTLVAPLQKLPPYVQRPLIPTKPQDILRLSTGAVGVSNPRGTRLGTRCVNPDDAEKNRNNENGCEDRPEVIHIVQI